MLAKTDVAKIFETILSSPGMTDMVKISMNIPRKNVLLLSKVIERGIEGKNADEKTNGILEIIPKENFQELLSISADILQKAGLAEMNEKLKNFLNSLFQKLSEKHKLPRPKAWQLFYDFLQTKNPHCAGQQNKKLL